MLFQGIIRIWALPSGLCFPCAKFALTHFSHLATLRHSSYQFTPQIRQIILCLRVHVLWLEHRLPCFTKLSLIFQTAVEVLLFPRVLPWPLHLPPPTSSFPSYHLVYFLFRLCHKQKLSLFACLLTYWPSAPTRMWVWGRKLDEFYLKLDLLLYPQYLAECLTYRRG